MNDTNEIDEDSNVRNTDSLQKQQQQAFEKFMLDKKKSKQGRKDTSQQPAPAPSSSLSSFEISNKTTTSPTKFSSPQSTQPRIISEISHHSPETSSFRSPKEKQSEKRLWTLFHTFRKTVEEDWLDLENQIVLCFQSISNLQYRIPMEIQLVHAFHTVGDHDQNHQNPQQDWIHSGFINTTLPLQIHLPMVESTLSTDCKQHERLVSTLRSLLSSLSQCQDQLGTLMEESYRIQESIYSLSFTNNNNSFTQDDINTTLQPQQQQYDLFTLSQSLFSIMNQVYLILSQELYNKQYYTLQLLGIVSTEEEEEENGQYTTKGEEVEENSSLRNRFKHTSHHPSNRYSKNPWFHYSNMSYYQSYSKMIPTLKEDNDMAMDTTPIYKLFKSITGERKS